MNLLSPHTTETWPEADAKINTFMCVDEDAVGTTAGHKVGSLDPGVAPSSNSQRHSELEVIGDNATGLVSLT